MIARGWLVAMAVVVVAMTAAAPPVHADNKADALFAKGKAELSAKHFEAACRDFKASLDADPSAIGTMVNLAHCFEVWGRLATGLRWYKEAQLAAQKAHDDRAKQIGTRIAALDPQVPRLTVRVGGVAKGTEVQIDGVVMPADQVGKEVLVDPGPHVVAVVRNGVRNTKTVPVEPGGSSDVVVDAPPVPAGPAHETAPVPGPTPELGTAPPPTQPAVVDADTGHGRRVAAVAIGAGGVVAMAAAGVITLRAKSRYDDALRGDCDNDKASCDADGLSATASARKEANVATGVFAGGAALVGLGVVLYLTSPSAESATEHALRVVPDGRGFALVGSF